MGNWIGVYGADGYNIIEDAESYPGYATVTPSGETVDGWTSSTTDVRALENAPPGTGRIAAMWYTTTTFTVDIDFTDGKPHQFSIYCVDWDLTTRRETITIQDANTGVVLNTQDLSSSFNGGVWLRWTVTGHIKMVVTRTGANNAVVSGLFFDPPPATCLFLGEDTSTQGNWIGVYGADGYNVIHNCRIS